jgi:hypothetical protein
MAHDVVADDGAVVDGLELGPMWMVSRTARAWPRLPLEDVMSCFSPALEVFAIERACNCEIHCVAKVGSD